MATPVDPNKSSKYWKSIEQLNDDPQFLKDAEKEFLNSPFVEEKDPTSARRDFMKLMGASLALGSTGCLRRPVQKIIPYVNRPHEIIPGIANYYSSAFLDGSEGFGLVVKTREGRPIYVKGNKDFPINQGGSSSRAQAHVLDLYDPDRLQTPQRNLHNDERTNRDSIATTWGEVDKKMAKMLPQGDVVVLTSTLASPSENKIVDEFVRKFGGRHVVWDQYGADDVVEAQKRSYGKAVLPRYRFDKADLIVSIGADFLGTYLSPTEFSKQFASRRNPEGDMNRLVVFESMMSLTGSNADERYTVRASQQLSLVVAIIKSLEGKVDLTKYGDLASYSTGSLTVDRNVVAKIANQLWEARGKSLVIAGGLNSKTAQSVELQVAVNALNSILGNDGETIDGTNAVSLTQQGSSTDLKALIEDMNAEKVKTLIVYGANPAYVLPRNSGFHTALKKVKLSVSIGGQNETAVVCDYMLPGDHEMEAWGDYEFRPGLKLLRQPTIRPLYDSRSLGDALLKWSDLAGKKLADGNWYDYVKKNWSSTLSKSGKSWDDVLQTGFVDLNSGADGGGSKRRFNSSSLSDVKSLITNSKFELVLYKKAAIGDGRYANVPWLQELPDPVTKVVWDNYANIAPAAAKELGVKEGDILKLKVGEAEIKVPAHIQPGVDKSTIAVAVGYGRTQAGKVANGVGVDVASLVKFDGLNTAYAGVAVEVKKTFDSHVLANTQGHDTMFGRHLVGETTLSEHKKDPLSGVPQPHFVGSIWDDHKYKGHKWGMTVDLNTCTGCSVCTTACQSENNVPVVGKKYILEGREMHWIRIDRYYKGSEDSPDTVHQPVMCQHCDNAPCETVCPVVATSHSDDGLNEMTYNRCVGTRYCANNCPYKVRRFNWFKFDNYRAPSEMALNPSVTVRSRGVMEKCSFCVQRIREATGVAKDEKRPLKDGDVVTACQEACPSNAIIFGDVNDPDSAISKSLRDKRGYELLADINAKPAVKYLTKIRHREPAPHADNGGHH